MSTEPEEAAVGGLSEAEIEAHDITAYMAELKRCGALPVEHSGTEALPNFPASAPTAIREWIEERIRSGKNVHSDPQIIWAQLLADRMEVDTSAALQNFPASTPVNSDKYDPEGLGRANTEGWPRHPRPYKVVFAK